MTMTSIGDLAQTHFLRRHTTATKSDLDRLTAEVATGKAADSGAHLRGDFTALSAIDSTLARLAAYGSVTADLSLRAEAQQRALAHVDEAATGAGAALVTSAYGATAGTAAAGGQARQALDVALSALNQRLGDRALFAGADSGGPAILGAAEMMDAVQTSLAGATDAPAVLAAVDAWFAAPNGFAAAYLGDDAAPPLTIAPGEVAGLDITAADPALRDTIKALVLGSLLADPGFGTPTTRATLAQRAGESLAGLATDRATLAGRLGSTQQRIEEAATRNSAEASALGMARNDLLAVDPYDTATRLQETETRLEMIYSLTARLSRLSLLDHL
jgi:flagellar hook-associated protein 3 FlgL